MSRVRGPARPMCAALAALALLGAGRGAVAQPYAFIAAPAANPPVVHVVDLAGMALEHSIGGMFDEPAAFALSPDRTRLYVSSWRSQAGVQTGFVIAIDTRLRQVVATRAVGQRQSRAIALSPDGAVVYAWALDLASGPQERRLVRLDAGTLAILDETALPQPDCRATLYNALAVHPDGRVMLLACESGLKWFDPATASVVDAPGTLWGSDVLGFSPTATEVYLTDERDPANGMQSRLTALELASGIEQRFTYAIPVGQPVPQAASRPRRVRWAQRPSDPPGAPAAIVLFGSGGPLAFAQLFGVSPWSELAQAPSPATRRIVGSAVVGASGAFPFGQMAATDDGTTLLVVGSATRKFDSATFAPVGPVLNLPGMAEGISDVALVPFPPDALFANGFEP